MRHDTTVELIEAIYMLHVVGDVVAASSSIRPDQFRLSAGTPSHSDKPIWSVNDVRFNFDLSVVASCCLGLAALATKTTRPRATSHYWNLWSDPRRNLPNDVCKSNYAWDRGLAANGAIKFDFSWKLISVNSVQINRTAFVITLPPFTMPLSHKERDRQRKSTYLRLSVAYIGLPLLTLKVQ